MSTNNGSERSKRKLASSPARHRPNKQMREAADEHHHDDDYSDNEVMADLEQRGGFPNDDSPEESEQILSMPPTAGMHDSAEWQRTIEKVVRNVVSIRFSQTCSFDTDSAITSEATGFVVDAEKGYILTNRHVVCAGPFWGFCVFDNHEEVS